MTKKSFKEISVNIKNAIARTNFKIMSNANKLICDEEKKKNSKIFYHIHKCGFHDDEWKIGKILEITKNEFIKFSLDFTPYINIYDKTSVPLIDAINYVQELNDTKAQIELLSLAKNCINEYQILIRELAFEEIRRKKFENLPSRYNCIFLCRKDQIEYWKKRLNHQDYIVYKIEIYGEPFRSREKLLSKPYESYNSICKHALAYWQYNSSKNFEDDEYLYEGKFKILDTY